MLIIYGGLGQTIVFCPTKAEANSLLLSEKINKSIEVMHGDIAQKQREVTLQRFKEHKFSTLVATDVAARGLDIPSVDLVIQVEPPKDVESYIHRAGRTARAGKYGTCITFWTMKHKMAMKTIAQRAGVNFKVIGIPQPEDVIRATSRDSIKKLTTVNETVLPLFGDAADELIALSDGDARNALLKALAFLSGCHKETMTNRSLLSGQEKCMTFQMDLQTTFHGVGLIWNILRRWLPEAIAGSIMGMRALASMNGGVFDVPEDKAEEFEDIFKQAAEKGRLDFTVKRCTVLPTLLEVDRRNTSAGGYQGQNPRNGHGAGGYGAGRSFGGGAGGASRGGRGGEGGGRPQRNQDASVFVGNLAFTCDEREVSAMFSAKGLNTASIRLLKDDAGRPKGSAFVDFSSPAEAQRACQLDGQTLGSGKRPLRINPAARR